MMRKRMRVGATGRKRMSVAVGAVALAFGAIVLARAHGEARAPEPARAETPVAAQQGPTRIAVDTPELEGFVALTQGAVLAHGTREVFGELRLEAGADGEARRRPVALAVALDVSGSMSGDKIVQARHAVEQLAARMRDGDRLAVVTYNHEASLLTPLTPIRDARPRLAAGIAGLYAGGGTNIPAGLSLAAHALSAAPGDMVRRLVVVSDGQDGSGIALEGVAQEVGGRAQGGTTTSALGVGIDYDERWLTTVADAGRGNYEFLAGGGELARFLGRELEQASTTVAERTELALTLPAGWRVAQAYGANVPAGSSMSGGTAVVPLGALFAGERRRVTVRMEVDAGAPGELSSADLALRYRAIALRTDRNLALGRLSIAVVGDEAQVASSRDVALHAEAVAQDVDARQAQAIEAWRQGRAQEAQRLALDNARVLERWRENAPEAEEMIDDRLGAVNADLDNFRTTGAGSAAGREYGLRSNARRRARSTAF